MAAASHTDAAEARNKKKAPDGPTFGTEQPIYGAFRGLFYLLDKQTGWLPEFSKRQPSGVYYTNALNYSLREFDKEFFGIEYNGKFYIQTEGKYTFWLESDDGAQLWIDGRRLINNDGIHASEELQADIHLNPGEHTIRIPYFQGPRPYVALILNIRPPKGKKRIFDMRDYRTPTTDEMPAGDRPTVRRTQEPPSEN